MFRVIGIIISLVRIFRVWVKGFRSWGGNIYIYFVGIVRVGDFFGGLRFGFEFFLFWEFRWGLVRLEG